MDCWHCKGQAKRFRKDRKCYQRYPQRILVDQPKRLLGDMQCSSSIHRRYHERVFSNRRTKSFNVSPSAAQICLSSKMSSCLSPDSYLLMKVWSLWIRTGSSLCVSPASRLSSRRSFRSCLCWGEWSSFARGVYKSPWAICEIRMFLALVRSTTLFTLVAVTCLSSAAYSQTAPEIAKQA